MPLPPTEPPTLRQVVGVLEGLYPPATALDWDQVGLACGDLDQPVRLVHFAVDPTIAVIDEAIRASADLLVTHHPLLLRGIHSVATSSAKGYAVTQAVRAGLALYCAHTNADLATPGVSDALAVACGLAQTEALDQEGGWALGRVGELPESRTLGAFAEALAAALPPTQVGVRVSGDREALVRRVAVLGGSGDDRFESVRRCGADVYVTSDLRHHPASEAREDARGGPPYLIDAGHFATEWLWLGGAAARLRDGLTGGAPAATTVETYISTLRTDPWDFVVGANADGGATC